MRKHWDIMFGTGGVLGVLTLDDINKVIAFVTGVLVIAITGLRLRREWRLRNSKKDPDEN